MRPRLAIALVVLVIAPLVALGWLGSKVARDERDLVREELQRLLLVRLGDVDGTVAHFVAERRRSLDDLTRLPSYDAASIRARTRKTPFIRQIFVRGADGELVYPSLDGALTDGERQFLRRTRQLWAGADSLERPSEKSTEGGPPALQGWYVSYWENGLNLIYWRREESGQIVGAELSRVRLLSDIVAELPAMGEGTTPLTDGRIALLDARGAVVYQWGEHEPAPGELPRVQRSLSEPLSAWRLQYFMAPTAFESAAGSGVIMSLIAGIVALGLALAGLAFYFYRESSREIRDATQRVSFVNQVSHELKTPLTNIRMYAELLERDVEPGNDRAVRHLGIIVSESQRLSRLIGNVLTFARQRREALSLRPAPAVLDEVVSELLEQFGPAFEQKKIAVSFERGAPHPVLFDRDIVAQIIGNLMSNVEKYAASGRRLDIALSANGATSSVTVRDHGVGIPAASAEEIFEPFSRLDGATTEGVSGAGIGLALARDLARLHGGDLTLVTVDEGACFKLTLNTPRADDHESTSR